ncbi:Eukaryotic peptide chain release factor subunit 1 [Frankliniella fusca]|uniref:Eukaryotic peptide chain release factor subunit 1 n=1 Tax=Frankliniella fusca TaxID=407009 RepID=A0AAE1GZB9_9NEOP|nr:Eukaryotic peptide chain release factor subunit 1 [Frankliniella fusca]
MRLLLLPALLVCLSPSPGPGPSAGLAQAAPWSGIVGFLQTVARLQERPVWPESTEDEGEDADNHKPLRKIVYGVEEQVSAEDGTAKGSLVVYDSLKAATTTRPDNALDSNIVRKRRSSEKTTLAGSGKATGRQTAAGIAPRPFLIGRRLWYVPLWFSVYLILYILALTVKSVARHRIKYPTLIAEDALLKRRNGFVKSDVTRRVTNAITNGERRYQGQWSM